MKQIPDCPIIRCMEQTGWPPWLQPDRYYTPERAEENDEGGEAHERQKRHLRPLPLL